VSTPTIKGNCTEAAGLHPHYSRLNCYLSANLGNSLMPTTFFVWTCLVIALSYCSTASPSNHIPYHRALSAISAYNYLPRRSIPRSSEREWYVLVVRPIGQGDVPGVMRGRCCPAVRSVVCLSKASPCIRMCGN
jgi:hypothetical protein